MRLSLGSVNPKDNKLQIELCGMDELYLMYVNDFTNVFKEKYLGKNHFRKIFKDVFSPVVQIRKRKSVTGKCQICALLSFIRSRAKSQVEIEAISKLHMIHKIGFMGERNSYYERRALAMRLPMEYLSLITDGMAQIHCLLPWMKGKAQPSNVNLKQHLQGTFVHGKGIYIYRTFNNVKVNSFFFLKKKCCIFLISYSLSVSLVERQSSNTCPAFTVRALQNRWTASADFVRPD